MIFQALALIAIIVTAVIVGLFSYKIEHIK